MCVRMVFHGLLAVRCCLPVRLGDLASTAGNLGTPGRSASHLHDLAIVRRALSSLQRHRLLSGRNMTSGQVGAVDQRCSFASHQQKTASGVIRRVFIVSVHCGRRQEAVVLRALTLVAQRRVRCAHALRGTRALAQTCRRFRRPVLGWHGVPGCAVGLRQVVTDTFCARFVASRGIFPQRTERTVPLSADIHNQAAGAGAAALHTVFSMGQRYTSRFSSRQNVASTVCLPRGGLLRPPAKADPSSQRDGPRTIVGGIAWPPELVQHFVLCSLRPTKARHRYISGGHGWPR